MKFRIPGYPLITISIIAIAYLSSFLYLDKWSDAIFGGDSHGYYLHVVSFFIYNDVGNYNNSIASIKEVHPGYVDPREDSLT